MSVEKITFYEFKNGSIAKLVISYKGKERKESIFTFRKRIPEVLIPNTHDFRNQEVYFHSVHVNIDQKNITKGLEISSNIEKVSIGSNLIVKQTNGCRLIFSSLPGTKITDLVVKDFCITKVKQEPYSKSRKVYGVRMKTINRTHRPYFEYSPKVVLNEDAYENDTLFKIDADNGELIREISYYLYMNYIHFALKTSFGRVWKKLEFSFDETSYKKEGYHIVDYIYHGDKVEFLWQKDEPVVHQKELHSGPTTIICSPYKKSQYIYENHVSESLKRLTISNKVRKLAAFEHLKNLKQLNIICTVKRLKKVICVLRQSNIFATLVDLNIFNLPFNEVFLKKLFKLIKYLKNLEKLELNYLKAPTNYNLLYARYAGEYPHLLQHHISQDGRKIMTVSVKDPTIFLDLKEDKEAITFLGFLQKSKSKSIAQMTLDCKVKSKFSRWFQRRVFSQLIRKSNILNELRDKKSFQQSGGKLHSQEWLYWRSLLSQELQ